MARILALDIGERRIGVAVSDETATVAQPLVVIAREGTAKDVERITQIARQHAVHEVVVGLPVTLRGEQAQAVQKVQAFVAHLRRALDVPIVLVDERLSTAEANRRMREADVGRGARRQKVDAVAAALILEKYLSQRSAKGNRYA
ncbi:MAG: Holliday junction resolvase RuvX [Armatimonadota bacterium]